MTLPPDSLRARCVAVLAANVDMMAEWPPLPPLLARAVLDELRKLDPDGLPRDVLRVVPGAAELLELDLSDSPSVTDATLAPLAPGVPLRSLSLAGSLNVTDAGLAHIAQCAGATVESLDVSRCSFSSAGLIKTLPAFTQLQHLVLSTSMDESDDVEVLRSLPASLVAVHFVDDPKNLVFPTLSADLAAEAVSTACPALKALTLRVKETHAALGELLLCMPALQYLDLSGVQQLSESQPQVHEFLLRLPQLRWLDVSATDLNVDAVCALMTLSRLTYLGVIGLPSLAAVTPDDGASWRPPDEADWSPGLVVAASAGPVTFALTAASVALPAGVVEAAASAVLRRLFSVADSPGVPRDQCLAVFAGVAAAMRAHALSLDVQIAGTGVLFFLTRPEAQLPAPADQPPPPPPPPALNPPTRVAALAAVRRALKHFGHRSVEVARNSALTLRCHFDADTELAVHAAELCERMFAAASALTDYSLRINAMVFCGSHLATLPPVWKEPVGAVGIPRAVALLAQLMHEFPPGTPADTVDLHVLEATWTFLWNITDDTAVNCYLLFEHDILNLVQLTLECYPENAVLRHNIMGLLTNIAEVPELRERLMDRAAMESLRSCLDRRPPDELKISYNVAGTLCHLIAEGVEFWEKHGYSLEEREQVLVSLGYVVSQWPSEMQTAWISYRSLKPVIQLLNPRLPHELHHWVAWALCNLCRTYPTKYSRLITIADGVTAIQALMVCDGLPPVVTELLQITLNLITNAL